MNPNNSMKWHAYLTEQTEWIATICKARKAITWFPNKANWLTFLKFAMRNDLWGRRDNIEAVVYELLLGQASKKRMENT